MPESYIQAWEDELPEHPVVAELRAQPGRWAILASPRDEASQAVYDACKWHPNVQAESGWRGPHERPGPCRARWLPDPVVAAIQILKEGGYGG